MNKKNLLILAFAILCSLAKAQQSNATATVEQHDGICIFVKSRPTKPFELLGTVKGPAISSAEFDTMLRKMLKKVKEEHPTAQGLIFTGEMLGSETYRVEAIRFKE